MNQPDDLTGDLFPWEVDEPGREAAVAPAAADVDEDDAPGSLTRTAEEDLRGDDRSADARHAIERSAHETARERPIAQREYYSISEVCDIVGLKPHVLRYWEAQFPPLNPSKNRSGNRVYQRKEIQLIMLVKRLLYEDKYTIEGARARIEQMRRTGKVREIAGRALDAEMVDLLRSELEHLRDLLTPSA